MNPNAMEFNAYNFRDLIDLDDSESVSSNSTAFGNTSMSMSFRAKLSTDPDADYEDDDVFEIEPTLNCNGLDLSYDSENDLDSSLSLITKKIKEIKILSKKKTCSSNLVPFSKQDLTPDSNHQTLLFDSHCHLDRIYSRGFNKPVSTFYQPMGRCFTMSS